MSRKGSTPSDQLRNNLLGPSGKKIEKGKFIKAISNKRRSFSFTQPVWNQLQSGNPIINAKTKEEIFTTCQDIKGLTENLLREEIQESKEKRQKLPPQTVIMEKKNRTLESGEFKAGGRGNQI